MQNFDGDVAAVQLYARVFGLVGAERSVYIFVFSVPNVLIVSESD